MCRYNYNCHILHAYFRYFITYRQYPKSEEKMFIRPHNSYITLYKS
jgi:hypothetical protein